MRTRAGRLVLTFLSVALAPVLALVLALLAYDPLAIYHSPWGRPSTVHHNMRLQAVGAIRHEPFDSVLLGTSILENSSAEEASRLLGGRFVNLSISAGDFFERGLILDFLLRRRKIKQIVYSLDFIYLTQRKGYQVFPLPTFDYLYDGNPFNDIRVYLNGHFLGCLARWSHEPDCVGRPVGYDRPNAWFGDPDQAARFGGLDKWCLAKDNYQIRADYKKIVTAASHVSAGVAERLTPAEQRERDARALDYIESNLIRLISTHPETRFDLVFPPYSRVKFAIWYQDKRGDVETDRAVVRYLAAKSAQLPNLRVYGFEDQDFLDDLARYKDIDHFDPAINSMITQAIASGTHRITLANVEAYLDEARRRAEVCPLADLAARLRDCGVVPP